MSDFKSRTNINQISKIGILISFLLLVLGVWSYLQTEILTYTSDIDGRSICTESNLKYYRVLAFDGIVGKAEMICIRENLSESTYLKLNLVKTDYNRKQSWETIFTQKVFADGGFFWPIYI